MLTHDFPVGRADLLQLREIFGTAREIPGHADDMLGPALRLGEHGQDVPQRLGDLLGKTRVREAAITWVPADLACDEHLTALGEHTVAVSQGALPIGRLQESQ